MKLHRWLTKLHRRPPPHRKDQVDIDELHELVRFCNDTDYKIGLKVEPWGEDYLIEPSAEVVLMTDTYPIDEAAEIAISADRISIFWRANEVLYVFQNGARMVPYCPPPEES